MLVVSGNGVSVVCQYRVSVSGAGVGCWLVTVLCPRGYHVHTHRLPSLLAMPSTHGLYLCYLRKMECSIIC